MTTLIDELKNILDANGLLTGNDAKTREEAWSFGASQATTIVRPKTTDELSRVMAACHRHKQRVITHGGKTGMVGACTAQPNEIVITTERMNRIEQIDRDNHTMIVQAGVPLQLVQTAAEEAGLCFPLDFGARGSATLGGCISTNAGGNRVIRYGMTRELILGLEVVLADGTVISSMSEVIKNNAGYDIKQLFIGSEGTLGIVTRAVLRLSSLLPTLNTVLAALDSFDKVTQLLQRTNANLGGQLCAFEVMWDNFYNIASKKADTPPFTQPYPFYVLLESQGSSPEADHAQFEAFLETALEEGLICDAVLPQSRHEREKLWAIRDNIESLFALWPLFIFDISVPIHRMQLYLDVTETRLRERWPAMQRCVFGHLGDGNLHIVVAVGSDSADTRHAVEDIVYGELQTLHGSVSAEHGIGLEKKNYLRYSRSEAEIALMRTIKQALDPHNLLNAGRILDCA